jgi:hypothetical protein
LDASLDVGTASLTPAIFSSAMARLPSGASRQRMLIFV